MPTDPETFNLLTSKMKDTIPDVLEDIARDNIILKENRWPYVSTRAPVTTLTLMALRVDPRTCD